MLANLTQEQKYLLISNNSKIIIKGSPGCGKTTAIVEIIKYHLHHWKEPNKGIACLSFSNIAGKEILKDFPQKEIQYPHFIGTIDSFINQYITLPYGGQFLQCNKRPELVGDPVAPWNGGFNFYEKLFDKYSFDENSNLISIVRKAPLSISSELNRMKMEQAKRNLFKRGFINQSDSLYVAKQLITLKPEIFKLLARHFPLIIIDEAQDTSKIQMCIIDEIIRNKPSQVILIGDPDQAIYAWNNALPELFKEKFDNKHWDNKTWYDNFRSPQNICDFTFNLSELKHKATSKHITNPDVSIPKFIAYEDINDLAQKVEHYHSQNLESNSAIVTKRSQTIKEINQVLGICDENRSIWESENWGVAKAIKIGIAITNGDIVSAMEQGEQLLSSILRQPRETSMNCKKRIIQEEGLIPWRKSVYSLVKEAPHIEVITVGTYISYWNNYLQEKLGISNFIASSPEIANTPLSDMQTSETAQLGYIRTIHSVKGQSYDKLCLILDTSYGSSTYSNLLSKKFRTLNPTEKEAYRAIYVAITRARKELEIFVPRNDLLKWQDLFSSNKPINMRGESLSLFQ